MNIFTSNPDFYPTPDEVIERMMNCEFVAGKVVLEPSAGKGNIVDWLYKNGAKEVIACENDPNIRKLLSGKCNIIADDFLSVTSDMVSHVDMIVMNPPFSQGARHILHAYQIAPEGCTIIALCNSSNLGRGYWKTVNSQLQDLIDLYGHSEELGACFAEDAERHTRCEVTAIRLYKPGTNENEFDGYFFSEEDEDAANSYNQAGLMQYNLVRELVNRYVSAVKLFDETLAATERLNEAATFVDYSMDENGKEKKNEYGYLPVRFGAMTRDDKSTTVTHDQYKKALQKYYWRIIFAKLNMEKYATTQLKEQINKFVEQQQNIPFTMKNVYRMLDIVIQTTGQRMQKALLEAFDTICDLSAENSTAGEKWKTNANYMVNKRFIVPYMTNWDSRWPRETVSLSYSGNSSKLEDVTKALCFITGEKYEEFGSLDSYIYRCNPVYGVWFQWGFFKCIAYKKGTMHFEFLDEDVWFKFNYECAKYRGWNLPKKTEKKRATPKRKAKTSEGGAMEIFKEVV